MNRHESHETVYPTGLFPALLDQFCLDALKLFKPADTKRSYAIIAAELVADTSDHFSQWHRRYCPGHSDSLALDIQPERMRGA